MKKSSGIRRTYFRFVKWTDEIRREKYHDSIDYWETEAAASRAQPSFNDVDLGLLQICCIPGNEKEKSGTLVRITCSGDAPNQDSQAIIKFFSDSGIEVVEDKEHVVEEGDFFIN